MVTTVRLADIRMTCSFRIFQSIPTIPPNSKSRRSGRLVTSKTPTEVECLDDGLLGCRDVIVVVHTMERSLHRKPYWRHCWISGCQMMQKTVLASHRQVGYRSEVRCWLTYLIFLLLLYFYI